MAVPTTLTCRGSQVEPLEPPASARPGERVWFGEGSQAQPAPAEPNRVQKKKIWEGACGLAPAPARARSLPEPIGDSQGARLLRAAERKQPVRAPDCL